MSTFPDAPGGVFSPYLEQTRTNNQCDKTECKMVQKKKKKNRLPHVLTNTQPLSYHFSHLGVNAFGATCQTPTCFDFTTRVLAPLPPSAGNMDKRAIIVLLFRVPHELLTFLEDLAEVPFFLPSHTPPVLMISGQKPAQNEVSTGQWTQPFPPSFRGAKQANTTWRCCSHTST